MPGVCREVQRSSAKVHGRKARRQIVWVYGRTRYNEEAEPCLRRMVDHPLERPARGLAAGGMACMGSSGHLIDAIKGAADMRSVAESLSRFLHEAECCVMG